MIEIGYILEHLSAGWLAYEIDGLSDLQARITIHPVNPALYGSFAGEARCRKRTMPGDIAAAGIVSLSHPLAVPSLFRRLSSYAGTKIATAVLSTARIVGRQRPDLLHAHFATAPAAAAWAVSRLTGVPYGFSAHAYDLFKEPVDRGFLTLKCADAAFVRCISDYNREHLVKSTGIDDSKFHVIHCGIDTSRFTVDGKHPAERPHKRTIVTVGNLVEQKGIRYLIEALSDPAIKRAACRTVIVGDGLLREELTALASSLGVEAEFTGAVDNSRIMQFYREADLFVLPSVTCADGHRDGIPVVLMEAMACGVPVISTGISGIPELVEDGVSGVLVPEKDPRALSGAIGTVLADAGMRRRFSVEGRTKVVNEFDIRDVAGRLLDLFESVRAAGGGDGRAR